MAKKKPIDFMVGVTPRVDPLAVKPYLSATREQMIEQARQLDPTVQPFQRPILPGTQETFEQEERKIRSEQRQSELKKEIRESEKRTELAKKGQLGPREIKDVVKDVLDKPASYLPFLSFTDDLELMSSAIKVQNGTASEEEKLRVTLQQRKLEEEAQRGATIPARAAEIVANLPGFALEFAASGGMSALGRGAVERGLAKVATKKIGEKVLSTIPGRVASETAKLGVSSALRVGALPTRVIENYLQRTRPEIQLSTEDINDVKVNVIDNPEPAIPALGKALGDVWIETFTEGLGGGWLGLKSIAKDKALKMGVAEMWLKSGKPVSALAEKAKAVGYHGIVSEMMEERAGETLRAVFGVSDTDLEGMDDTAIGRLKEQANKWASADFANQLGAEALAFAVPGVGMKIAEKAPALAEKLKKEAESAANEILSEPKNLRLQRREGERGHIVIGSDVKAEAPSPTAPPPTPTAPPTAGQETPPESGGTMGGFAKRMVDQGIVMPEDEAGKATAILSNEAIKAREEEFKLKTQNLAEAKAEVESLSPEEKRADFEKLMSGKLEGPAENKGILSASSLLMDKYASGDIQGTVDLVKQMSNTGRVFGQVIRQFAEVKNANPVYVTEIFDLALKERERELTPEQKQEHTDMAAKSIADTKAKNEALEKFNTNPLDENVAMELDKATAEATKSAVDLMQYQKALVPPTWPELISGIIRGNLLTTLSQSRNVASNLFTFPLKASYNAIAAPVDALRTAIKGGRREVMLQNPLKGLVPFGQGLKKAAKQILTGVPQDEMVAGESSIQGFTPFRALKQARTGEGLAVTPEGKVSKEDRLKRLVEGTFGVNAEAMFRLLALGDTPFKEAKKAMLIDEFVRLRKLSGADAVKFRKTMSGKDGETIKQEMLESVFQQENPFVTNVIRPIFKFGRKFGGGFGETAIVANLPYVQTPTNLITEGIQLASPEISLALAANSFRKGENRKGAEYVGKAAVGYVMLQTAFLMLREGMLTGDPDKDKLTDLRYSAQKPNTLNLSALHRLGSGESTEYRPGDLAIDYKYLGFFGLISNLVANHGDNMIKEGERVDEASLGVPLASMAVELPQAVMSASVLKGTYGLLDAIQNGNYEQFWKNYFGSVASVPIPNNLSAVFRATEENIPTAKELDDMSPFEKAIRAKTGATDGWPVVRDILGRKVARTPEGRNPWVYNFVDVFRAYRTPDDKYINAIKKIYDETKNDDAIPSQPSEFLTVDNERIDLSGQEQERLVELTGEERMKRLDKVIPRLEGKEASAQVELLDEAYRDGAREAKKRFLSETGRGKAPKKTANLSESERAEMLELTK